MLKERAWNFALGMAFSTVMGVVFSLELLDRKLLEEDAVALELLALLEEDTAILELLVLLEEDTDMLELLVLLEEDTAVLELLALLEDETVPVGRMSSLCFAYRFSRAGLVVSKLPNLFLLPSVMDQLIRPQ